MNSEIQHIRTQVVPQNRISDVSFKYIERFNSKESPQYIRKNFDLNFICRYCKNEHTLIINDSAVLSDYVNNFKLCSFWKMIHCTVCSAYFFTYKLNNLIKS